MYLKKDEGMEAGIFVLPGPLDPDKLRPVGRGVPLADAPVEGQEAGFMRDSVVNEINSRIQAVEQALRQQEGALTQGINAFAEKVVCVMVEEWQRALEEQKKALAEQEKRYLEAMKSLLEQTALTGSRTEPERPASWLYRLFDNKNQT